MSDDEVHSFGVTFRYPSEFLCKELLKLWVQVKFRLVEDKAGISGVRVEGDKQRDDFLKSVAFHFFQVVLHVPCFIHHHRNVGTVGNLLEDNGFAEHARKHALNLFPDSLVSLKNCQSLPVCPLFFPQKFYVVTVGGKDIGNGFH